MSSGDRPGRGAAPSALAVAAGALACLAMRPCVAPAAGTVSCQGPSVTYTVDCWNSGFFVFCGSVSYACSNCSNFSFQNDCPFTDALPGCACVTQVCVELFGEGCPDGFDCCTGSCTSTAINVSLNGTLVGTSVWAGVCAPNTCNSYILNSPTYACPSGFSGYVYNGTNVLNVSFGGVFCLAYANVIVSYQYVCTPSASPSRTWTVSPTASPSATRSPTVSPTHTLSHTASATDSASATATSTPSDSASSTVSPSATVSESASVSATPTASPTPSDSPSASPSRTDTPSRTASASPTGTRTTSGTRTLTGSATDTAQPAPPTATATGSESPTPSASRTATGTASDSPSPSPSRTATASRSSSPTAPPSQTRTHSPTPTPIPCSTPTRTGSATPSRTATASPTATVSPTAMVPPTGTGTATPSASPTVATPPSASATPTDTATSTASPALPPPFLTVSRNLARPGDPLEIRWRMSRAGPLRISVYDSAGEIVQRLWDSEIAADRVYAIHWDLRNREGEAVSSNVYVLRVTGPAAFLHVAKIGVLR